MSNNLEAKSIRMDHIKAIDSKIKKEFDITKDVSVVSLDMAYIYRWGYTGYDFNKYKNNPRTHTIEKADKVKQKFAKAPVLKVSENRYLLNKKFTCKIPYSLCLDYIYSTYPKEFAVDSFGHQYTDIIVNITCKESYRELDINKKGEVKTVVSRKKDKSGKFINESVDKLKVVMSKENLRKYITNNGFVLNGVKYVYYKRSGSKARCGSVLFVKEDYKEIIELWSRLGIKFEPGEEIDNKLAIAGILAYESLDLSHNLPNKVYIKPDQILLIDDIKVFAPNTEMIVSELVDNNLITKRKQVKEIVTITDGQSLIDISILKECGYEDKGCVLLRQKMMKSCAFSTRIIDFMKEKYGDEYDTSFTTDMLGRKVKVSDIRWIVTPSSLKFFKFYKKFKGATRKDQYQEVYNIWLKDLAENENKFGVCKTEQASPFGIYNQLSYQIIQALMLNKRQLEELIKDHLNYYKSLRNDNTIFNYFKKDLQYRSSNDMIDNLCAVCDKAVDTPIYRDKKNDTLTYYREKMRNGKILVKDTDYAIVVSDPVTMLYRAIGQTKFVSKGYEIYCKRYDDNIMLFETRNPVVCSGNIGHVKNKYYDEYKWFNLTDNIAVITGVGNNLYTKNSGMDMDSDSVIISSNSILVSQAKYCHENFLIPCNNISQTEKDMKKKQFYTLDDIAEADYKISENYIGQVINCSQILNSIWQDTFYDIEELKEKFKEAKLLEKYEQKQKLYETLRSAYKVKKLQLEEVMMDIVACNNMSNVEIDKAKKQLSVDSATEIIKILRKPYINRNKKKISSKSISTTKYNKLIELQNKLDDTQAKDNIDKITSEIIDIVTYAVNAVSRPNFFKYTTDKSDNYNYVQMKCSMDFLEDILSEEFSKDSRGKEYVSISELLNVNNGAWAAADRKHILKIKSFGIECNNRIKSLKYLSKEEKSSSMTRDEIVEYFANIMKNTIKHPKILTLQCVIAKCFTDKEDKDNLKIYDDEFYGMRNLMMDLLYKTYGDLILQCFVMIGNGTIETLKEYAGEEVSQEIIEILGKKYIKTRRKIYDNQINIEYEALMRA